MNDVNRCALAFGDDCFQVDNPNLLRGEATGPVATNMERAALTRVSFDKFIERFDAKFADASEFAMDRPNPPISWIILRAWLHRLQKTLQSQAVDRSFVRHLSRTFSLEKLS